MLKRGAEKAAKRERDMGCTARRTREREEKKLNKRGTGAGGER